MLFSPQIKAKLKVLCPTVVFIIIADQATKAAIKGLLRIGDTITVVPGLFNIVYIKNTGAAFGILQNTGVIGKGILIATSALALVVIAIILRGSRNKVLTLALSLIAGGALGNIIDRFRYGSVVDFLDFYVKGYHWPAFNVADSAITIGVIMAVSSMYLAKEPANDGPV
jgi:signal peptidase II